MGPDSKCSIMLVDMIWVERDTERGWAEEMTCPGKEESKWPWMQNLEMNRERPETLTSVNSQNQGTLERRDLGGETRSWLCQWMRCLGRSEGYKQRRTGSLWVHFCLHISTFPSSPAKNLKDSFSARFVFVLSFHTQTTMDFARQSFVGCGFWNLSF